MGLLMTITAGLCVWIVLWAIGTKPDDAALVGLAIVLVGVTVRIVSTYLKTGRDS